MKNNYGVLFLYLILFFFNNFSLLASCGHELSVDQIQASLNDIGNTFTKEFRLKRKSSELLCDEFFLSLSRGNSSGYLRFARNEARGDVLFYNFYKNSQATQILKPFSDIASQSDYLFGTILNNQNLVLNFYFQIKPVYGQFAPRHGVYQDRILVESYSGNRFSTSKREDSETLQVKIHVPKFSELSLVDSGSPFDKNDTTQVLDFGELENQEELNFDIVVVSNVGHEVLFSSQNLGVLKNVQSNGQTVQYEMYVGNQIKNLNTTNVVASNSSITPSSGTRYAVRVKIKNVDNKLPGLYNDNVTVTLRAKD